MMIQRKIGTNCLLDQNIKLKLKFGPPIDLEDLRTLETSKETSKKVVMRIMEDIEKLRPEGPYMVQKTRVWQKPLLSMFRKIQNIKKEHY